MNTEDLLKRIQPRRKIEGAAAALLPFEADGRIAVNAFQAHLRATHDAGLTNAVNMDTGYVNYLTDDEKSQVLNWTRDALGPGVPFIAGAYIEGRDGEIVALYRREIERIAALGGTPIIFQTARLHDASTHDKVATYAAICKGFPAVLGFELGKMFAPNGEIFDEDTFRGIMNIPEMKGLKHSSLDRLQELRRLELRDANRPEFRIYTGNDLAINMVEYGSDYLLGLATFAPEKFAERDRLWLEGDPAYYALSDALQNLGNIAFRPPVPAYKHSAAHFLHMTGSIPSPRAHPRNPIRPTWEGDLMHDCAIRLGLVTMFSDPFGNAVEALGTEFLQEVRKRIAPVKNRFFQPPVPSDPSHMKDGLLKPPPYLADPELRRVAMDLAELAVESGIDVNVECSPDGSTFLHGVVLLRDPSIAAEAVTWLLAHGADPNKSRHDGESPLSLATKFGRTEIVDLMRRESH